MKNAIREATILLAAYGTTVLWVTALTGQTVPWWVGAVVGGLIGWRGGKMQTQARTAQ